MTENYVQIDDSEIVRFKIKTKDGKDTGNELTFNINDIELPLLYQDMIYAIRKNAEKLRNDYVVIDKREDLKGKKLLSKNQEDKIKAFNEFVKKQLQAYNIFLGEGGAEKILNGRKLGWTTIKEIDDIIEQIEPKLEMSLNNIVDKIVNKYSEKDKKEMK